MNELLSATDQDGEGPQPRLVGLEDHGTFTAEDIQKMVEDGLEVRAIGFGQAVFSLEAIRTELQINPQREQLYRLGQLALSGREQAILTAQNRL
jgi:hypothetical protein